VEVINENTRFIDALEPGNNNNNLRNKLNSWTLLC
jgi:hypothetical protein